MPKKGYKQTEEHKEKVQLATGRFDKKAFFNCLQCGKKFQAHICERERGGAKFCSPECGYENKRRRTIIKCEYCGIKIRVKTYDIERGKGKFCSKGCFGKWFSENMAGENNPRFGRKESLETRIRMSESGKRAKAHLRKPERDYLWDLRKSFEYNEWRLNVYKRDYYTCQMCGINANETKRIDAHHIFSFVDYPKLRFNVDNGITYCEECHKILTGILRTGDIFQPLPRLNI